MSNALMMSIKSGAKLVISYENYKHSLRFFIFHADFCFFVVRIVQHNLVISVHLPHSFNGVVFINGFHIHDAT